MALSTQLLPTAIIALAAVLAGMTWYATLMPFWISQAGHKDDQVYYSQGIGLWLNYTEHVGDVTFDPGNSLWIPPQFSAVETFHAQCQDTRAFCANAIGELHLQYCEVMKVYCGPATTIVQLLMSLLSGAALLIVIWCVALVVIPRRTLIDHHLMHVAIGTGLGFLVVATLWYFTFFRVVLNTTFYKDQYTRCELNPTNRTCWHMGLCVYLLISVSVLYPLLSVLVASYVAQKFKRFQRTLRQLHEATTVVELPPSTMNKAESSVDESSNDSAELEAGKATNRSIAGEHRPLEISLSQLSTVSSSNPRTLAPLQSQSSTQSPPLRAISVHEMDAVLLSDGEEEEEKARQDQVAYGDRQYVVQSPPSRRKAGKSDDDSAAEPKQPSKSRRFARQSTREAEL
ncbi:hypothetical protein Poli38472_014358 [Pythium oligandrum]|uniref:Uncharacterized protein n=1 Tax=Pythium oligandrum TaxID=41045 RepID=A0A8K1C7K0_PYTOL|nr:hypothetical protein Poli38472_014358 [Pythium oligandrum]|eukprot:TMW57755.1 hypothetical protein Poli38472_014358 [Pythium oligandrum]